VRCGAFLWLGAGVCVPVRPDLLDAVSDDAEHNNYGCQQPHHPSGILPRLSDVVVSAAGVLALLSVREKGHYDYHANTDQREHGALT
jgi:hypothetical protein